MKEYAVLFPGQGSQGVGMAADVFAQRSDLLGSAADVVLGWSMARLAAEGPESELTRTDRAQPVLFATAFALYEALAAAVDHPPAAAAGHSLGEYTALAAAGAFGYWDGLRLVAARGEAMGRAAAMADSGMAALVGADLAAAELIAERRTLEGGRLWVANVNTPKQIVLAGGAEDLDWLDDHAREMGVRRVVRLKVAGAFHTPFMEPAREDLRAALGAVAFATPAFVVYANATGCPISDIAGELEDQLVGRVRFAESLQRIAAAGIRTFVHVGPGDVTAGLARRTVEDADVVVVTNLDDVPAAATLLSVE